MVIVYSYKGNKPPHVDIVKETVRKEIQLLIMQTHASVRPLHSFLLGRFKFQNMNNTRSISVNISLVLLKQRNITNISFDHKTSKCPAISMHCCLLYLDAFWLRVQKNSRLNVSYKRIQREVSTL